MINKITERLKEVYSSMFLAAFFLLTFIFFNVLISTIFFIFKVSIQSSYVLISLVLSVVTNLFFMKKKDLKNIIIALVLPIIIIFFSIFINGKVFDYTWDGNSYQKATTGMLAIGWNPLYEELEEFDDNSKEQINIGDESPIYINNYAKASNILAANIYKFTGNIETGKAINTITIAMLFLFTFSFLLYKDKTLIFSLLFSLCVVTYPVVCAQFLTNYIDLLVYAFLYLTIFSFFIFEEENFVFSKNDNLILFLMLISLSINIKFSLFGYVGIYCLAYYIWYIWRLKKGTIDKKFFTDFTVTAIISVLMGIFVIGLSVYPKNLVDHSNPFYPLMGDGQVDIMTQNQPKEFKEKSSIQKFVISLFSEVDDIIEDSDEKIKLKFPFSVQKEELDHVGLADLRLSGNGIFFSGIFLISVIVLIMLIPNLYKLNSKACILLVLPLMVTVVMAFFLNEAWWARYFPQLYFFVLCASLLLEKFYDNKYSKVLMYGIISILLINNFITFQSALRMSYHNNVICNMEFQKYDSLNLSEDAELTVYTNSFNGAKFNILDKVKQSNVTFINKYEQDKTGINTFMGGRMEWRYKDE